MNITALIHHSQAGLCSQETCRKLQVASASSSNMQDEAAPDKLSLALEPESAAIYCQSMSQQQLAAYCDADRPYTSQCYLLVDVGGGTVDITAHTAATRDQIKVVQPPTGNDCGGSRVNKQFQIFLGNLVDDKEFTAFINTGDAESDAKNTALIGELVNETFEKQKTFFGSKMKKGNEDKQLSIRLPYEFIETYKAALEEGIQHTGDSRVQLAARGQELRIKYSKMEEFFQPVISGILECISQALNEVEGKVETIYLVGGFGGSHYLFAAISKQIDCKYKLKYVIPAGPEFAVVRGAVLFHQNPEAVHTRRVDATYGIETNLIFDARIHDVEYKWTDDDDTEQCSNIFCTIVEKGDEVCSSEVFQKTFCPALHGQTSVGICLYSSLEKDIWYVTGKRPKKSHITQPATVHKIGEFTVKMPILTGDKSREVHTTFDFSRTEIQVKGYDRTSGNEVKIVLDFLSM